MTKIKLTTDEIKSLTDLRTDISNLYLQIGQLYLQRKEAMDEFDTKEKEFITSKDSLKERETKLYHSIGDKYGHGNVDLETGIFTPISEVENNK